MRYAHQGDRDVGRIWEDELDFLKLASPPPVFRQEDPTRVSIDAFDYASGYHTSQPRYLQVHEQQ